MDTPENPSSMLAEDMAKCEEAYNARFGYLKGLKTKLEESNFQEHAQKFYRHLISKIWPSLDFRHVSLEDFRDLLTSNYYLGDESMSVELLDERLKEKICTFIITLERSAATGLEIAEPASSPIRTEKSPFVRICVNEYVLCIHWSVEKNP